MSISNSLLLAHTAAIAVLYITAKGASNFHNITDALAFYGVYHRNPINQIIHFFGVPCIIWSLLLFLSHLNLPLIRPIRVKILFAPRHSLNYASVLTIGYILFYIKLDKFGGTLYAPFAYFLYVTAVSMQVKDQIKASQEQDEVDKIMKEKEKTNGDIAKVKAKSSSWVGTGRALKLASIIHFLGWYVQIHPGHGIFEGAKPAVMQSIGGALTSAPLFAYYEGLWYLGLNKELQDSTKALVDVYSKQMCDNGASMRACSNYSN